jgi:hypothetical protein
MRLSHLFSVENDHEFSFPRINVDGVIATRNGFTMSAADFSNDKNFIIKAAR